MILRRRAYNFDGVAIFNDFAVSCTVYVPIVFILFISWALISSCLRVGINLSFHLEPHFCWIVFVDICISVRKHCTRFTQTSLLIMCTNRCRSANSLANVPCFVGADYEVFRASFESSQCFEQYAQHSTRTCTEVAKISLLRFFRVQCFDFRHIHLMYALIRVNDPLVHTPLRSTRTRTVEMTPMETWTTRACAGWRTQTCFARIVRGLILVYSLKFHIFCCSVQKWRSNTPQICYKPRHHCREQPRKAAGWHGWLCFKRLAQRLLYALSWLATTDRTTHKQNTDFPLRCPIYSKAPKRKSFQIKLH